MTSKQIILSHIYDYLKLKKWKFEAKGKIINMICPYCMDKSLTAQAINNTHLIKCHNPDCSREGKKYTIISIVKHHEKDKLKWDNDKIVDYLKGLLKVKVLTTSDKKELETLFKKYQEYGWALTPNAKNDKKSIEDFNNKIHKDSKEWMEWVELGLNIGVRCGEVSNLTLVDIDTDKMPNEIKDCLGKTLAEKSTKGWHYFYKYDEELPNCRIDELSIEIRNNELQTTITPSTVEGIKRNFINNNPIIEVPEALKKVIKKYKKVIKKTETDKDISDEIAQETYQKILMREGDGRNQFFIRFGGILSKFLNREQVRRVLKRLDKVICNPNLGRELDKTVFKSIEKYKFIEDEELISQILDYLREVEEAEMRDIERAIMGSYPTSDDKARIDKAVAYLKREDLIQKRGKIFKITKKLNWSTDLTSGALSLDFKVPYFDDIMYFNKGDVCIIGAKPGTGKTHIAVNCLKKLVEQGVKPYYYSLESGSRFKPIALQLGLKEGDFFYPSEQYKEYDPTKIELEDNAVTIIDWLSPRQYKYTDKIIEHFNHQLDKHGGFLIIFVQLRKSTGDWFAKDLIEQFPAFAVKYFLDDEDGIFGHFEISKMRASQRKTRKIGSLPTKFSWETKEIERVDRLTSNIKESGDEEDFDIDDGKQEEK